MPVNALGYGLSNCGVHYTTGKPSVVCWYISLKRKFEDKQDKNFKKKWNMSQHIFVNTQRFWQHCATDVCYQLVFQISVVSLQKKIVGCILKFNLMVHRQKFREPCCKSRRNKCGSACKMFIGLCEQISVKGNRWSCTCCVWTDAAK